MSEEAVLERTGVESAADRVRRGAELYAQSRYLDAHRELESLGPYSTWSALEGRVLASRITRQLGAPRLSDALVWTTHRRHPQDHDARFQHAILLLRRRGPLPTLRWLRAHPPPSEAAAELRADFLAVEANCLTWLRDFEEASDRCERARRLAPEDPWVLVEQAFLEGQRDRPEAALELARAALALRPSYRPALLSLAHQLTDLRRPEEAVALLDASASQSYTVHHYRAELWLQLGDPARAEAAAHEALEAAPLVELAVERGLRALRAEAFYRARRYRRARRELEGIERPFERRFREALARLGDGASPPRIELQVPYVRQDHVTCAPASLTSLAAYYGRAVDHDAVAEEICYAGTSSSRERRWATENGFVAREFDVTLEAARALLERGHPFTLTTRWTSQAHLQVACGYDAARGTFILRDPSTPWLVEADARALLEEQGWSGPRGMTLVPRERAGELDGIELPQVALWDLLYRGQTYLEDQGVERATEVLDEMRALAPGHRLTLQFALEVARQRGDRRAQVAHLDALLELAPRTPRWVIDRAAAMRDLESRSARREYLFAHSDSKDSDLLNAIAEELRHEGRTLETAARLLRKSIRLRPQSAFALHVLADLEATRHGDPAATLELYRFASRLDPFDEHFAQAYFDFARLLGRGEEALAWLVQRVEEARGRSALPARTLYAVCCDTGAPERGLATLLDCAEKRSDDAALALVIAGAHLDLGQLEQGEEWLTRAKSTSGGEASGGDTSRSGAAGSSARSSDVLALQARIAGLRGNNAAARAALEAAVAADPHRADTHEALTDWLADHEGPEAAIAYLEGAYAERPELRRLFELLASFLRYRDDARAIELLRARLTEHPDDAWARRELALALERGGDREQGLAVVDEAIEWLPYDTYAHSIRGDLLLHLGRREEAREALRRAIELDVDNRAAIALLADAGESQEERREDLRFVHARLLARVSAGPGVAAFADASHCFDPAERVESLSTLEQHQRDVPVAADAAVRAVEATGDLDTAWKRLEEARERFPCNPELLLTRARLAFLRGDDAEERGSLESLVRLAPFWTSPRLRLARHLKTRGLEEEAAELLEQGLALRPRDASWRMERALLDWRRGRREEALELLQQSLLDVLGVDEAFSYLLSWSRTLGRGDDLIERLRAITREYPSAALYFYRLAEALDEPEQLEEKLSALRAALRANPRYEDAADALAFTLSNAGRHQEALDSCPPAEWRGPVPLTLLGRRAWVQAGAGRLDEAIQAMEELLQQDPGYTWGRVRLADWYERLERWEEHTRHCEAFVQYAPHDGVAHGYLGDALLRSGDRAGALASFRRAVELLPSYEFAARRCFTLLLEDRAFTEAEAVLERCASALRQPAARSMRARLLVARGDVEEALEELEALCVEEELQRDELEVVLDAFGATAAWDRAFRVVEAHFEQETAAPGALAEAWCNARERAAPARADRILARREHLEEAGRLAVAAWIQRLGEQRRTLGILWMRFRYGGWLRRSDATWGALGYALCAAGLFTLCARWLADFRKRPAAEPWMLYNLVSSLWSLGRGTSAIEVARVGLELGGPAAAHQLGAWVTFHDALVGDDAQSEPDDCPLPGDDEALHERALAQLTRSLRAARRSQGAGPRAVLREAGPALRAARELTPAARDIERAYSATRAAILRLLPPWARPLAFLTPLRWW